MIFMKLHPNLLLVDDDIYYRRTYKSSLSKIGFHVSLLDNADLLSDYLFGRYFDIIVCDTNSDIGKLDGPYAIENAIKIGLIRDSVLIVGMSEEVENKKLWEGIAHHGAFYHKYFSQDSECDIRSTLAFKIMNHYRNFEKAQTGSIWREKMAKTF